MIRPCLLPATFLAYAIPACAVLGWARPALSAAPWESGQGQGSAGDTLHLGELQLRAVDADPRGGEIALQMRSTDLRIRNLATDRLPRLWFRGDASYQSETAALPGAAFAVDPPPKERYAASMEADWTIWDGGSADARREAEEAQLTATLAGLDAELFELRFEVADAFFSALTLQEQLTETSLLRDDLRARLGELRERVRAGVALAGDTAVLLAEVLEVEQNLAVLRADRRAALRVLGDLTDTPVGPDDVLVLPQLEEPVRRVRETLARRAADSGTPGSLPAPLRAHPQILALDAARTARDQQMAVVGAARRPTVAAFGSMAWGSPGYRQFTDDPHDYWRAGLRVQWQPWEWGRTSREVERLRVEQRLLDTREQELVKRLLRALEPPLERIRAMEEALVADARIIALRQQAESLAATRFRERTVSAARYTDARSDVQQARVRQVRHRIDRVRAQARYLLILGLELPKP